MEHFQLTNNKEILDLYIINELRNLGIKYKDKKASIEQPAVQPGKKLFRQHIYNLILTEVILFNGTAVQIPKFVADACNRILEQVEVEGIFRKAGSSVRQKEIRRYLEAGFSVSKSHHVIDIANVLKYFFRELPEPIIPVAIQDILLKSLIIGENSLKAILLSCLLLPSLSLNTLSFFMQFLNTVSRNSDSNKMNARNLAIIFTPSLMPFVDIDCPRFNKHVKLIQVLVENANLIGSVPDYISEKIRQNNLVSPNKFNQQCVSVQKKKKRRSDVLSGFRKIVGAAIGSSENLVDRSPEKETVLSNESAELLTTSNGGNQVLRATPCIKASKKRRFVDPISAFSAKKRKDFLSLLPTGSSGLVPSTPLIKESKSSRQSLGVNRTIKPTKTILPAPVSMERRWSIIGTSWSKMKNKNSNCTTNNENELVCKKLPEMETEDMKNDCNTQIMNFEKTDGVHLSDLNIFQLHQNEYDTIKERVLAIETRISEEFSKVRKSLSEHNSSFENDLNGPERVKLKYEQVLKATDMLSSPMTDHLVKRLSRDLTIRPGTENRVIRSPSARKIGSLKRRSAERLRVTRNKTWHISATSSQHQKQDRFINGEAMDGKQDKIFYTNPNKLRVNGVSDNKSQYIEENDQSASKNVCQIIDEENWTSGEDFFKSSDVTSGKQIIDGYQSNNLQQGTPNIFQTPAKNVNFANENVNLEANTNFTPMLPPKRMVRKNVRTPNDLARMTLSAYKHQNGHNGFLSTPMEDENGRASIARLRSQNAGMVMAKAKLFDGICSSSSIEANNRRNVDKAKDTTPISGKVQRKKIRPTRIDSGLCNSTINSPRKINSYESKHVTSDAYGQNYAIGSPVGQNKRQRLHINRIQQSKNMQRGLTKTEISYRNNFSSNFKPDTSKKILLNNANCNESPRNLTIRNSKCIAR